MKILTRYLLRNFLITFALVEAILTFIYLLVDFIGKIDSFLAKQVSFNIIIMYLLSKVPISVSQLSPVAILIASIIFVMTMVRRKEILILVSSGISTVGIKLRLAAISCFIALFSFIIGEFVATKSWDTSHEIIKYYIKQDEAKHGVVRDRVWHKIGNIICYCDRFIQSSSTIERPIIIFLDENFNINRKIIGKKGSYSEKHSWVFEKVYEQVLDRDGSIKTEAYDTIVIQLPVTPTELAEAAPDPLLMDIFQLKRFIEKISNAGYDTTTYLVDFYTRISFPFIHIIMVFVGTVLSLILKQKPIPVVVSISILICFVYLLIFGIFRSVALSGVLHPLVALSLPNAIFLVLAYLMNQFEV